MSNKLKKVVYIVSILSLVATCFSCGKKAKSKWVERGAEISTEKITPGVHPERGSISDATPVYNAIIYIPLGLQEKEVIDANDKNKKTKKIKREYKTVMYEMNELTPEDIDAALKYYKVLGPDTEFYNLDTEGDDNAVKTAGPGGVDTRSLKGVVSYVDFISSALDNSSEYEGKGLNERDLIGKIDQTDIEHCIIETYISNFNLTSCEVQLVDSNGKVKDK